VRIGIVAPPDVTVHRKEVFDRILEFAEPQAPAAHHETVPS
jgi:sRNA-binding carbon storage regulator CsrA